MGFSGKKTGTCSAKPDIFGVIVHVHTFTFHLSFSSYFHQQRSSYLRRALGNTTANDERRPYGGLSGEGEGGSRWVSLSSPSLQAASQRIQRNRH